jgi:hypothetical protein
LTKPSLKTNGDIKLEWNKEPILKNISPEWITSHKPTIQYVPTNKYKPPYNYLNDKYIVNWFFIPNCEEDFNSKNTSNWSKNGLPCLGGYDLLVLINANGTINQAELKVLN